MCGLPAIPTQQIVEVKKKSNGEGRREITWLDKSLCFPFDALLEVIGLGITLITALLINRWGLYWFH